MEFKNLNLIKLEEDVEMNEEKIKKSEFYKEKGNELFKKSMFDDALDCYFKSITLNPKNAVCYANIGQILINKSLYSEAKECLQSAIDLNSNYTKAYYRLGLVEKNLKNYNEALINFDKVLKLEPDNKASLKECDEIKRSLGINQQQNAINGNLDKISKIANQKLSNEKRVLLNQKDVTSNSSTNKSIKNIKNLTFPKIKIPTKLPETLPKTAYQFNLYWKEIKDNDKIKLDYLNFIGAKHFLKLFQKNIEPDFLSELISLFQAMNKQLVFDLLNSITKIDQFDFTIMFLSKNEKEALKQTIQSLPADSQRLDSLIKLFKI